MPSKMLAAGDIIIEAFEQGRPIVPFLGAGVSVGTGFPTMTAITAYLAKVRFHIRHVADPERVGEMSDAEFLRRYGWPDIHLLNADMWYYLASPPDVAEEKRRLAQLAKKCGCIESKNDRDDLEKLVAQRWDRREHRVRLATQIQLLEILGNKDQNVATNLWRKVVRGKLELRGDWYDLMMSLTEGDFDLVDALFVTLGKGRSPAAAHVFLAQLADAFRVRLYLSLNFDPFLEIALWEEGHAPNVIEVAKDSDLPSAEAIRDRLTVLKLHGGPYGLRIGERIQETADANTIQRASQILPEDALVVVMGFSGDERRITQVLTDHAGRTRKRQPNRRALLWMNFGTKPDAPVTVLKARLNLRDQPDDGPLAVRHYDDVPLFLFDLLVRYRHLHPAGRERYRCLPTRPWARAGNQGRLPKSNVVAFFRRSDWTGGEPRTDARGHADASLALARFCQERRSHHVIWIDCEQHHTVQGIVVDILDSIRRYDPSFPPLLMQRSAPSAAYGGSELPAAHERAIERIREALQRGNYILCIDSPETIGRPQTVHHGTPRLLHEESGTPHPDRIRDFTARVTQFFVFLEHLIARSVGGLGPADIGESYVCVAFATASPRHAIAGNPPAATLKLVDKCIANLKGVCEDNPKTIDSFDKVPQADLGSHKDADGRDLLSRLLDLLLNEVEDPLGVDRPIAYMILSVLRRPRSHLAYLALLNCPAAEAPATRDAASRFWDRLLDFTPAESSPIDFPHSYPDGSNYVGGSILWIPRRLHNVAYSRLTDVGHRVAAEVRGGRSASLDSDDVILGVLSLLAAAVLHRRAARYYFSEVYEATGDITAFREYIYHRISFLRLLCRLLIVIAPAGIKPEEDLRLRGLLANALRNYNYPRDWPHPVSPLLDPKGKTVPPAAPDWDTIRLGWRSAWYQELKAFRATLSREFEAVRRDLYADTWVSVIDYIRVFDFEEMWHKPAFRIPQGSDDPDGSLCLKELQELREDLRRQQLDALFEMADWDDTLAAQRHSLMAIEEKFAQGLRVGSHDLHPLVQATLQDIVGILPADHDLSKDLVASIEGGRSREGAGGICTTRLVKDALPPPVIPGRDGRTPADFVFWFMRLIEMAEGYSRVARVHHEIAIPGRKNQPVAAGGISGGASRGRENSAAATRDAYHAAAGRMAECLREWLDKVEELNQVGSIAPFSDEIQQFLRTHLTVLSLDLGEDRARFGFDKYNPWHDRHARDSRDPKRRNVTGDSIGWLSDTRKAALDLFEQSRRTVFQDVAIYNRYRAKSLRMVARSAVLSATRPEDFQKPIAELNLALRLLRRGRTADPLEEVACYRAKAEAYLLWGDVLAREVRDLPHATAARARLAASRSMIGRAFAAFDGRRRNVPWWLRLCRDCAQWAVVSCVLRVYEVRLLAADPEASRRLDAGPHERSRQDFEADLRYGLDAVRAGIDCILPVRGRRTGEAQTAIDISTEEQWKGFVRQWLSLGQAAWAFEASDKPAAFKANWQGVNRAARLPKLFEKWEATSTSGPLGPGDSSSRDYSALFDDIVPTDDGRNLAQILETLLGQFR